MPIKEINWWALFFFVSFISGGILSFLNAGAESFVLKGIYVLRGVLFILLAISIYVTVEKFSFPNIGIPVVLTIIFIDIVKYVFQTTEFLTRPISIIFNVNRSLVTELISLGTLVALIMIIDGLKKFKG